MNQKPTTVTAYALQCVTGTPNSIDVADNHVLVFTSSHAAKSWAAHRGCGPKWRVIPVTITIDTQEPRLRPPFRVYVGEDDNTEDPFGFFTGDNSLEFATLDAARGHVQEHIAQFPWIDEDRSVGSYLVARDADGRECERWSARDAASASPKPHYTVTLVNPRPRIVRALKRTAEAHGATLDVRRVVRRGSRAGWQDEVLDPKLADALRMAWHDTDTRIRRAETVPAASWEYVHTASNAPFDIRRARREAVAAVPNAARVDVHHPHGETTYHRRSGFWTRASSYSWVSGVGTYRVDVYADPEDGATAEEFAPIN